MRSSRGDTFDPAGLVAVVQRLSRPTPGETAYAPAFHRDIQAPMAVEIPLPVAVRPSVTKSYSLLMDDAPWGGARAFMDDVWLINVDPAQRQRRLLERHMRFGPTREDAMAWIEHTVEPNAVRSAATAARSDFRFLLQRTNALA